MTKFEQLIEYVINDDEAKAKALFHDIVVEKSRKIYEDLMQDDEVEEGMESAADASDSLMNDVEADEEGINEFDGDEGEFEADAEVTADAEDEFGDEEEEVATDEFGGDNEFAATDEFGSEEGSTEPATKDDILNLEDKLDELMAEFEELLGSDEGATDDEFAGDDEFADMDGGDDVAADGADEFATDDASEFEEEPAMAMENVSLKAAPKPVTSEEGSVNKKSTNANNSGAAGMNAKPVKSGANEGGKHDAAGAYSNQTKPLVGKVGNSPAQSTQSPKPATKPTLSQASGVNNKSPLPK